MISIVGIDGNVRPSGTFNGSSSMKTDWNCSLRISFLYIFGIWWTLAFKDWGTCCIVFQFLNEAPDEMQVDLTKLQMRCR